MKDDTHMDIHAQKTGEDALRESEDKFRTLVASMDQGYLLGEVLLDDQDKAIDILFLEANPAAVRIAGREFVGRRMRDIDPNYEEHWYEAFGRVALTGEPFRAERYAEPHDRWFEIHLSKVGSAESRRVASVFQDVTERKHAEKALSDREERYRTLFETIDEGFCVIELIRENGRTIDYRVIEVNPAFEHQSGLHNVAGKLGTEVAPFGDEEQWLKTYDEVTHTEKGQRFEQYYEPTGRWYSVYVAPTGDNMGSPRLAIVFTDITLRKQAETALRESEGKYRRLYTEMGQAYIEVELIRGSGGDAIDYRYLALNPAYERLTGIPIDQAVGRPSLEVIPDLSPFWAETFQRIVDNQAAEEFEYEEKALDRWYGIYAYPAGGDRLTVLALDITQRKKAEEALRESEEKYAGLFAASPAPFLILKPDAPRFTIADVNDAYLTATMRTREDLVGRAMFDAFTDNPDDPTADGVSNLRGSFERVLVSREFDLMDVQKYDIVRPDGTFEERWWKPANAPVADADGNVVAIIHHVADVTAEHRAGEALRESERRAQTLLAELQHRVRNVLAMFRSVVRRTSSSAYDLEAFVQHLQGRIDAMARTQTLLTRSPGKNVDLEDIVRDEMLAQAATEGKFGVYGPAVGLSPHAAEVLTLALHELATNSVKYGALGSSDGRITVSWECFDATADRRLELTWHEVGLAPPKERRAGFGTELIEKRVPYELNGRGELKFGADSLTVTIEFPLEDGSSILETTAMPRIGARDG